MRERIVLIDLAKIFHGHQWHITCVDHCVMVQSPKKIQQSSTINVIYTIREGLT